MKDKAIYYNWWSKQAGSAKNLLSNVPPLVALNSVQCSRPATSSGSADYDYFPPPMFMNTTEIKTSVNGIRDQVHAPSLLSTVVFSDVDRVHQRMKTK